MSEDEDSKNFTRKRPWRNLGADLTDYFNYGFNEETWVAYYRKQMRLRDNIRDQRGDTRCVEEEFQSSREPWDTVGSGCREESHRCPNDGATDLQMDATMSHQEDTMTAFPTAGHSRNPPCAFIPPQSSQIFPGTQGSDIRNSRYFWNDLVPGFPCHEESQGPTGLQNPIFSNNSGYFDGFHGPSTSQHHFPLVSHPWRFPHSIHAVSQPYSDYMTISPGAMHAWEHRKRRRRYTKDRGQFSARGHEKHSTRGQYEKNDYFTCSRYKKQKKHRDTREREHKHGSFRKGRGERRQRDSSEGQREASQRYKKQKKHRDTREREHKHGRFRKGRGERRQRDSSEGQREASRRYKKQKKHRDTTEREHKHGRFRKGRGERRQRDSSEGQREASQRYKKQKKHRDTTEREHKHGSFRKGRGKRRQRDSSEGQREASRRSSRVDDRKDRDRRSKEIKSD